MRSNMAFLIVIGSLCMTLPAMAADSESALGTAHELDVSQTVAVSLPPSRPPAQVAVSLPPSRPPAQVAVSLPPSRPPAQVAVSLPPSRPPAQVAVSLPPSRPPVHVASLRSALHEIEADTRNQRDARRDDLGGGACGEARSARCNGGVRHQSYVAGGSGGAASFVFR